MSAVYLNKGRVIVRRSTDSGATWLSPQRLAINASGSGWQDGPAIAAKDTSVDVVWLKNGRVRYARSTNSGASLRATMALSPENKLVTAPKVARGPNGLVVVVWGQAKRVPPGDGPWNIRGRVSTNGGASFGPARTLGQGMTTDGRQLAVAAGNGVAYVAFAGWQDIIVPGGIVVELGMPVRRTVDGGASWAPSTFFAGRYAPALSMAATGKQAYLAYEAAAEYCDQDDNCTYEHWIQYRRTTNKGASWSAARNITARSSQPGSWDPVIARKGGLVQVIFRRGAESIWYRQSSDGLNWTPPEQVSPDGLPAGVGHATKIVVLYSHEDNVLVRTGSP